MIYFLYILVYLPMCAIAIGIVQPVFLLEIIPVIIATIFVEKYYITTSRLV